jgi:signal recognition particle subunit SRP54
MAFENLSERLQATISKAKTGKLTEDNMKAMLREVRLALLEADVNFKVVKHFINEIKEEAEGQEVTKNLNSSQMLVKIVNDKLVDLFGGTAEPVNTDNKPVKILMSGLQGAGKTTHVGKLGSLLRKQDMLNPLFVACDIYRPAAIEQLKTLGKQLSIPVYDEGTNNPRVIAKNALKYAEENNHDLIIFDTAGRLHVDEELMAELKDVQEIVDPTDTLLVVDAMTGQDAINVTNSFNESVKLTGVILTKLDGDTRGGAALSIRYMTDLPIKYIGTGETLEAIQLFHPERMASRILGMGDVLTLIEEVESKIDQDEAERAAKRLQSGDFDLEDFLSQLKQIRNLGPLENILKMMPGASKMGLNNVNIDPKQLAHLEAIILSMTPEERKNPKILKNSRKQRIAKGCGRSTTEINRLIKQYDQMKQMMKMMKGGKMPKMPGMPGGKFKF